MSTATPETTTTLRDRAVKERLQQLRQTDNWTNWLYLARAWGLIVLSVAGAVAFSQTQMSQGWHFLWNVPVWGFALLVIGAAQHQLAACTHEATHYALFRNRLLNELASDWLCMYPLFSSTSIYRIHHLAHHQFVNDPEQDPDIAQLDRSGHWLKFPLRPGQMIWFLLRQLTLIPLLRYILVRARYASLGLDKNPYIDRNRPSSPWRTRIGLLHAAGLLPTMVLLSLYAPLWVTGVVPVAWTLVVMACMRAIPADRFLHSRLPQTIEPRTSALMRMAFIGLLLGGLGIAARILGYQVWIYFATLWVLPIFTTFSLFMILRQLVQHGNCDRGWLTNTRTFLIQPLIRFAVFPMGMDYHLPHHMYASVPHYNLARLHEVLMTVPEYREQCVIVEGYFFSPHAHQPRHPTVLEVLGPAYHQHGSQVYTDDSVVQAPPNEQASA